LYTGTMIEISGLIVNCLYDVSIVGGNVGVVTDSQELTTKLRFSERCSTLCPRDYVALQ